MTKPAPMDLLMAECAAAIDAAPVVQHSRGVNGLATKEAIRRAVERVLREHAPALNWLADR